MKRNTLTTLWTIGLALLATTLATQTAHAAGFTAKQRLSHLQFLYGKFNALPGKSVAADAKAMSDLLKKYPKVFNWVGVQDACVSARWVDGPVVVFNVLPTVSNTVLPSATPLATPLATVLAVEAEAAPTALSAEKAKAIRDANAAAPAAQLPAQKQARVLCTFPDTQKFADKLRAVVGSDRFQYTLVSSDATVEGLKKVQGDGLFYLDAHAGTVKVAGVPTCFVQTATPIALDSLGEPVNLADMKALRLVAMFTIENQVDDKGDLVKRKIYTRYGFGPKFVRDYKWSFGRHSFAWVNACYAANPPMRDAFFAAGASVYGGWTKSVRNIRAVDAGHFLLDRLLGANELRGMSGSFPPELIPQRAFSLDELTPELAKKKLDVDVTDDGEAKLVFERNTPKGHFGLLAPSIWWMYPDDQDDTLHLLGSFGDDPGDGNREVVIGGKDATGVVWKPDEIVCFLPGLESPGGYGDVYVTSRFAASNLARLTKWEGFFHYTHDDYMTLEYTIAARVFLRGDIRSVRHAPGSTPVPMEFIGLLSDHNSRAQFKASGHAEWQADRDRVFTWDWTGSRSFSNDRWGAGDSVTLFGSPDLANRKWETGLAVGHHDGLLINELYNNGTESFTYEHLVNVQPKIYGPSEKLTLRFDAKWNVAPGDTGWKEVDEVNGPFESQRGGFVTKARVQWPEGIKATAAPIGPFEKYQGS